MWIMRIVLGWVGAAVLLAAIVAAGVATANATVYSASAFVRDYLGALAAGRVDEVLALPGVDADGLDERMLEPAALGAFTWRITDDVERNGVHRIGVEFTAAGTGGQASGRADGRATLEVRRIGTRALLFPDWGFAASPVTTLSVGADGDGRFTVGELPLELSGDGPTAFAALTPGVYVLAHHSEYLVADDTVVLATGAMRSVDVHVRPNEAFLASAATALDDYLAGCTAQHVLFPTGCPFGHAIENRVASEPRWSIVEVPDVVPVAADERGLWELHGAEGTAHLSVEVQSLFDGSISELEKDVPFSVNAHLGFTGGTLTLVPFRESSRR